LLFSFFALERKNVALASFFIVATAFIKVFGIVAFSLFLLYPEKLKSAVYSLFWVLIFFTLPLLVISPFHLIMQYQGWMHLLVHDRSVWEGISVAGFLERWTGIEFRNGTLVIGILLFCLPFIHFRFFKDLKFRMLFLASVLIWIVIFNFRAESATYVIAITGVAIWYFIQPRNPVNLALLIFTLVFSILSPTDIFPRSFRNAYVIPYALKAVPCILVWLKLQYDLLIFQSAEK
jgi:hypothetical protein